MDFGSRLQKIAALLQDGKYVAASLATAAVLAIVYSFLYGAWIIPSTDIGFVRTAPLTVWDFSFMAVVSLLGGFSLQLWRARAAQASLFSGGVGGILASACTNCLGITFVALGGTAFLPLHAFIPYLDYIKAAVVGVLAFGFLASVDATCPSLPAKRKTRGPYFGLTRGHAAFFSGSTLPILLLLLVSVFLLVFQAASVFGLSNPTQPAAAESPDSLSGITAQVLPPGGFKSKAKWGTAISDMVKTGVLDPDKLERLLAQRYGQTLKPEWKKLLTGTRSDAYIAIDNDNAVFMMYLLWTFAKANQNDILLSSPFASSFGDYDIGVGKPGYGNVPLLQLSAGQLETARVVAENSYRPCCGQSAARPDCSHGFSLLGLIEIGASQGLSKEQLFEDSKGFNAFWYPAHYIQLAQYFKLKDGTPWKDVDPQTVMSYDYSSIAGARKIQNELARLN